MKQPSIQCEAAIFDVDGVLVDSTVVVERYWRNFARKHGLNPEKAILTAHGRRTEEAMRMLTPHIDVSEEAEKLVRNAAQDADGLRQMEGVASLISSLPNGRWAVATSGSRKTAEFRLKYAGITLPDVMITADDVNRGKPDPEVYIKASRKLGTLPEHCVVFEDSPAGVASGLAAGMRVIAVTTTHALQDLKTADFITHNLSAIDIVSDKNGLTVKIADILF